MAGVSDGQHQHAHQVMHLSHVLLKAQGLEARLSLQLGELVQDLPLQLHHMPAPLSRCSAIDRQVLPQHLHML